MRIGDLSRAGGLADAEAMATSNRLGPIRLADAPVGRLATRPDGVIVDASSGPAFAPLVDGSACSATKAAIHACTVALREAPRGRVGAVEMVPPGVQTDLAPCEAPTSMPAKKRAMGSGRPRLARAAACSASGRSRWGIVRPACRDGSVARSAGV